MDIEDSKIDPVGEPIEPLEPLANKSTNKRKIILLVIGVIVMTCICLSAFGILNLDFYAGPYSVEQVVVTDELGNDGRPLTHESKLVFSPIGRIDTAVYTSGIDATIGMIWYHEDVYQFEFFERTQNNYIATYLEGTKRTPLPSGEYRVEIHIGRDSPPNEVVYFTVEELEIEVIPPYPTPVGHQDLENAPYLEVPFVFDEVWQIGDDAWQINEAKIVFLSDAELLVIVAGTDLTPLDLSDSELETLAKPIAEYAINEGYWDQARQIQIDGETYKLDEPIAITLINPDNPGSGNRIRFGIDELLDSK